MTQGKKVALWVAGICFATWLFSVMRGEDVRGVNYVATTNTPTQARPQTAEERDRVWDECLSFFDQRTQPNQFAECLKDPNTWVIKEGARRRAVEEERERQFGPIGTVGVIHVPAPETGTPKPTR